MLLLLLLMVMVLLVLPFLQGGWCRPLCRCLQQLRHDFF
jgi:hypothetical protein